MEVSLEQLGRWTYRRPVISGAYITISLTLALTFALTLTLSPPMNNGAQFQYLLSLHGQYNERHCLSSSSSIR